MGEDTRYDESHRQIMTYAEALRWAMDQSLANDPRVLLLGEDIGLFGGAFGVTAGLLDKYGPQRVRDTPIAEAGIVAAGIGAAMMGMHPVVEIQFSDFLANAMDPIVNQAAKAHFMFGGTITVPLVIRAPFGGGAGLAAQHSQSFEAWFYHVPGLKVVVPGTPDDARGLLLAALADPNPVIVFEHKLLYSHRDEVQLSVTPLRLGQAVVRRTGRDATVVSYSLMSHRVLEAAQRLHHEDIDLEVIDLRSLVPLDIRTIQQSVAKTGRLVICHEAVRRGGVGADIVAQLMESDTFDHLDTPILRIAALDSPIPYSPVLERAVLPHVDSIVESIRVWWQKEVKTHGGA